MQLWRINRLQDIALARGKGCTAFDTAGKPYLDMLSGTWCNILGYGHPRWVEAVRSQVAKLPHLGSEFVAPEIEKALAKLEEILPSVLDRAVFLSTGSEAVELALKMACAATGARGVVVVEGGYYGATTYALSLSEVGQGAEYLPRLDGVHRLPKPDCRRCSAGEVWPCGRFSCLDPLRDVGRDQGESVAAVLYEPVMAAGGVLVPPTGYGERLRELANRCGALLIAEEVTTGVGRTGRWFGFEHDAIVPDILVIGKAIGAGLPVAVVVTTAEVEDRCQGILRHVQSHQNDPLSGQVAVTVISVLQDERLVDQVTERGAYLLEGLKELQARSSPIYDVRGKGLMVGVELGAEWTGVGAQVQHSLLEDGIIVDYQPHTATFRLFPPYVISEQEIDRFLATFGSTLRICVQETKWLRRHLH